MNENDSTYAKSGPTGAFDPNANGEHMFLSPFAVPSWEGRIAIDFATIEVSAIMAGLTLALVMRGVPLNTKPFHFYKTSESRMCIGVGRITNRFQMVGKPPDAANLSVQEAAETLIAWLDNEAVYPTQPWFEGGEERGLQLFDVPYRAHPAGFYGTLVAEPKWFEVHK